MLDFLVGNVIQTRGIRSISGTTPSPNKRLGLEGWLVVSCGTQSGQPLAANAP
jgi:hypothetical protein